MTSSNFLHIAAVQSGLIWEDPQSTRNHLDHMIKELDEPVDLILLPEMFPTGFTMNAHECAEDPEGESFDWMRSSAESLNVAMTGSIITRVGNQFYNRLYFVRPDGNYDTYDKRHTFSYAGEDKVYSKGKQRLVVEYKGWRICPLVCYDLRFPVWSRNTENFDVLIYIANWPESRIDAWDTLLAARAIENMCYTIGVNRVGQDGNGIIYSGHSATYDPLGVHSPKLESGEQGLLTSILKKDALVDSRKKYGFLNDRDGFEIKPDQHPEENK